MRVPFTYALLTSSWAVPLYFYYTLSNFLEYIEFNALWLFLAYFTYRYWFPAQRWLSFRKWVTGLEVASQFTNATIIKRQLSTDPTLYVWYSNTLMGLCFIAWGVCSNLLESTHALRSPNGTKRLNSCAQIEWLVSDRLLRFPIISDILRWLGCRPLTNATVQQCLFEQKNVCVLVPFPESEERELATSTYIRLCMHFGYNLCPVVSYGESAATQTVKLHDAFHGLLLSMCIPMNILLSPFINPSTKMTIVVTQSVRILQVSDPADDTVEYYRSRIKNALEDCEKHVDVSSSLN